MFPWAHYTISLLDMPTEILRGKSHGQKKKSVLSLIQAFRYRFGHMYYNNTLRAWPSPCCMRAIRHAVKEHSCSHSLQGKRGKQKHREMTWEPEKRGTRQTHSLLLRSFLPPTSSCALLYCRHDEANLSLSDWFLLTTPADKPCLFCRLTMSIVNLSFSKRNKVRSDETQMLIFLLME